MKSLFYQTALRIQRAYSSKLVTPHSGAVYYTDVMIGEVQVIEVPDDLHAINEEFVLSNCAPDTTRVLFKTRNSAFWSCILYRRDDWRSASDRSARRFARDQ